MWACEIPTGLCASHAFKSLLVKFFVGQATDRFSSGINPWSHFPKCQTIPLNAIWDEAVGVTSTNSKSQKIIPVAWGSLDNTWETNNCLPKPKKMWMLWSHRAMQPEALLSFTHWGCLVRDEPTKKTFHYSLGDIIHFLWQLGTTMNIHSTTVPQFSAVILWPQTSCTIFNINT